MLFIIFSHVLLQTGWFHCWHQRFLVMQTQRFVFKEKRPARGENKDISINNCCASVVSLMFRVHNRQHSLLDSWREVLFTVAVCCFVLVCLAPGVSANTLLESWQRCLSQRRLQRRLIRNPTLTSTSSNSCNQETTLAHPLTCKLAFRTVPKSRLEDTFFISGGLLWNSKGNRISKWTQSMSNSWQANQYLSTSHNMVNNNSLRQGQLWWQIIQSHGWSGKNLELEPWNCRQDQSSCYHSFTEAYIPETNVCNTVDAIRNLFWPTALYTGLYILSILTLMTTQWCQNRSQILKKS